MPRIIGVELPANKRVEFALQTIYGIGPTRAAEICERLNIKPELRAKELTDEYIAKITKILQDELVVEGDLRRQIAADIRRLQVINSYRGTRHKRNLPCRGQRTKTNSRTRKGRRVTVGAIRDKTERKLASKG